MSDGDKLTKVLKLRCMLLQTVKIRNLPTVFDAFFRMIVQSIRNTGNAVGSTRLCPNAVCIPSLYKLVDLVPKDRHKNEIENNAVRNTIQWEEFILLQVLEAVLFYVSCVGHYHVLSVLPASFQFGLSEAVSTNFQFGCSSCLFRIRKTLAAAIRPSLPHSRQLERCPCRTYPLFQGRIEYRPQWRFLCLYRNE